MKKSKKINIALIGYGYWGKIIYKYLTNINYFNLRYVYYKSLSGQDSALIIKDNGPEFVNSIGTIWNDESVKYVIIATPIKTHYMLVLDALNYHKNVLVEKPLTLNYEESKVLKYKAKNNNCILMTEYTYTFSKSLNFIQKYLKNNLVGKLKSINICFRQFGRFNNYDVFTLLGSHALSILDMFIPLHECIIKSYSKIIMGGIVTEGLVIFKSKDNTCHGNIDLSLHCPVREKKVILYCEKGTIIYDQYDSYSVKIYLFSENVNVLNKFEIKEKNKYSFDEDNNLRNALNSFVDTIKNRKNDNVDLAINIDKILESFIHDTNDTII